MYKELLGAARIDLDTVKVLTDKNLFAPAIYHCGQSVEKASKSIFSYYYKLHENMNEVDIERKLSKTYEHNLIVVVKEMIRILLNLYVEYEVREKPNLQSAKDKAYTILQNAINAVYQNKKVKNGALSRFDELVNRIYNNINRKLFFDTSSFDSNEQIEFVRNAFKNPENDYLKYLFIVHGLAVILNDMDKKTRYPLKEFGYRNLESFMSDDNRKPIFALIEMLEELLKSVPVVWKQLDLFKAKLPNG